MDFGKLVDALKKLLIFSASAHVILLVIYSIAGADIKPLNYFNILDIDLFFPAVLSPSYSFLLSAVVLAAVYLVIYFLFAKKS